MNLQTPMVPGAPDREDAAKALAVLRAWAGTAEASEIDALDPTVRAILTKDSVDDYPALTRDYPENFTADEAYKATMPDLAERP